MSRYATHVLVLLLGFLYAAGVRAQPEGGIRPLRDNWKLQSSCVAREGGAAIASPSYATAGWIDTTVPHTVLGAQVDAGIFRDPYFGKNLRDIPGTDYPPGKIFGYFPMSDSSPYRCSWWYRTEFTSPVSADRSLHLHFDGINYRGNVWLNGKQIANSERIAGAFRAYDFDVTQDVLHGESNVLAVEVFAQTENDLGIDFLDWNPAPADKNLGLWRDVSLVESGPLSLGKPFVATHFLDDKLSAADLTVAADVVNHSSKPVTGTLKGRIGSATFSEDVELAASEQKQVVFSADRFPQLRINHPRIWWPYQYGEPTLEELQMTLTVNGTESDARIVRFGIREAESSLDESNHAVFSINRRKILIRGGGWTPDLFYRESRTRDLQELQYVRAMHLNTIRLEGKLGSEDLFDLSDELGILVMAGWQCCDHWQHWDKWTPADHLIAHDSMVSQVTRLRSHPSVVVWLNGSDEIPAAEVEKDFLGVLKERLWPVGILSAAADRKSTVSGLTGVKMSGPYDYVPPEYWYLDKAKIGGAFGFNTETSPGPAIPLPSSIRRTLPKESWWPIDDQWRYHAGLGKFAQFDLFTQAMEATYGKSDDADRYNLKAQCMAYDGERAMFEAYGANKYEATGVIQWMLNNAWPSFIWHLYDYYLVPGGGFFGTRKANEPLHVQYRYDDSKIAIVNSSLSAYKGLEVKAQVVAMKGQILYVKEMNVDVEADGVATAMTIPRQPQTSFLRLSLTDAKKKLVSKNFYVMAKENADLDWAKSTYYYTPAKSYADMRDLAQLSPAQVLASVKKEAGAGSYTVSLHNASKSVAFCLQVRAVRNGDETDVAPAFWSDNYVSLLPGESTSLTLTVAADRARDLVFKVQGWNVAPQTIAVSRFLHAHGSEGLRSRKSAIVDARYGRWHE